MAARKKNAETLTRERIVEAAMTIIDTDGLEALSMRRLGSELGVNPMAAYHHVPNKAALYDLVLEAVMSGVEIPEQDPAVPVVERLAAAASAYRAAVLKHPHAIPVLAGRSLRTAAALKPVEPLIGLLFEAGVPATEAFAAVDVIAQYILGGAVGYYHHIVETEIGGRQREFEPLSPEEFPNTTRMLSEGRYLGFDGEFELGLDVIIRGLLSRPHITE